MLKLLAILLAAGAAYRLWRDWTLSVSQGDAFAMTPLGEAWTNWSPSSLEGLQALVSGFAGPDFQARVLSVPLGVLLLVMAATTWFLGRGPAPKRKNFGR